MAKIEPRWIDWEVIQDIAEEYGSRDPNVNYYEKPSWVIKLVQHILAQDAVYRSLRQTVNNLTYLNVLDAHDGEL